MVESDLAWYFPRHLVYVVARFLDRSAGRQGRGGRANVKLLTRIEHGVRNQGEVAKFVGLLSSVWWLVCVLSAVPILVLIAVAAVLDGLGDYTWLLGVAGSLIPGVFSLALVFYMHNIAMAQYAQDGSVSSRFVGHFLAPRRVNLTIIPIVMTLVFVIVGINTQWYQS